MRKELGKPTRDHFFARLAEIAPDFQKCSEYDIKGFTWSFLRQDASLYQWLCFQRHKYDDAFTVELAWSLQKQDPAIPPFRDPTEPFTSKGARFRLGAFWNNGGDYWWYVADPPPGILDQSPEDYLKSLASPPKVDLATALPRIHQTVDDAVARIQEHALPYFERVSVWARNST